MLRGDVICLRGQCWWFSQFFLDNFIYTGMINILHGLGLRLLALGHHTPFMVWYLSEYNHNVLLLVSLCVHFLSSLVLHICTFDSAFIKILIISCADGLQCFFIFEDYYFFKQLSIWNQDDHIQILFTG